MIGQGLRAKGEGRREKGEEKNLNLDLCLSKSERNIGKD
jgi:hypothetical protein